MQVRMIVCVCTTGLVFAVSAGSLGGVLVGENCHGNFHRTEV